MSIKYPLGALRIQDYPSCTQTRASSQRSHLPANVVFSLHRGYPALPKRRQTRQNPQPHISALSGALGSGQNRVCSLGQGCPHASKCIKVLNPCQVFPRKVPRSSRQAVPSAHYCVPSAHFWTLIGPTCLLVSALRPQPPHRPPNGPLWPSGVVLVPVSPLRLLRPIQPSG